MLIILIYCCKEVGDRSKHVVVISFWMTHLMDGTDLMPKYICGLFYEWLCSCWFL